MGHSKLTNLDGGAELWTGDAFEYLYVLDRGKEYHLPQDALYGALADELRKKVISAAEQCRSWKTLAAVLHTLETSDRISDLEYRNDREDNYQREQNERS